MKTPEQLQEIENDFIAFSQKHSLDACLLVRDGENLLNMGSPRISAVLDRMAQVYEKSTTTEEAKQGFPDFCKLPTEDDLVITKEPVKGFALRRVCELLNEALTLDALAVDNIITNHVVCNKALADHPTIQVRKTFGERYTTSILGILNGLSDGTQYLIAQYDPNSGVLTGFDVVGHETIDTLESVSKIEEKLDS